MKKIVSKISVLLLFAVTFCGCEDVEGLINMLNCKFEVQDVENFTFAGVRFDELNSPDDISDADMAIIDEAIEAGDAPVYFTLNIIGTNPNDVTASVEKLQWKLAIDSLDIAEGVVTDGFTIPAESSDTLSLIVNANILDVYNDNVTENVFNLYQDIKNGRKSVVTIKIKPTINETEFPDYITLQYLTNDEE
jgi:hypothetical protein